MKHVNCGRTADFLFRDIDIVQKTNFAHKLNRGKYFGGNIRINLGLYRTPLEAERYISESLKRKLP